MFANKQAPRLRTHPLWDMNVCIFVIQCSATQATQRAPAASLDMAAAAASAAAASSGGGSTRATGTGTLKVRAPPPAVQVPSGGPAYSRNLDAICVLFLGWVRVGVGVCPLVCVHESCMGGERGAWKYVRESACAC